MGIPLSKPGDIELVIEKNVVDLIFRLNEEEGYFDSVLQRHIPQALQLNSQQIEELRNKGHISYDKMIKLQNLIDKASTDLADLITNESKFDIAGLDQQDLKVLEDVITNFKNKGTINGIETMDQAKFFKFCHFYSQQLNAMSVEENARFSVIITEGFLKLPLKEFSEIFNEDLEALDNICKHFEELNLNNISVYNRRNISQKFLEMKAKMEHLTSLINKNFLNDISTSNILKKIHKDLKDCHMLTKNLVPPTKSDVIKRIKSKILYLEQQLSDVPEDNEEIATKKECFSKKAKTILENLRRIEDNNEAIKKDWTKLNQLNSKVLSVFNSDEEFSSKKSQLQKILQEVDKVDITRSKELQARKWNLIKKIHVFIGILSASFLKDVKEEIARFTDYAKTFCFTKNVNLYEMRKQEIQLFLDKLLDLLSEEHFEQQCADAESQAYKALNILEKRAEENQQYLHLVEQLEELKSLITVINQNENPPIMKLQDLNKIRSKINGIQMCDPAILKKKHDVYTHLHKVEEMILESLSPEIQELKNSLIKEERTVLEFKEFLSSDAYKELKDRIENLDTLDPQNEAFPVVKETLQHILEILYFTASRNKDKDDRLQNVKTIKKKISSLLVSKSPVQETFILLEQYYKLLCSIEGCSKELDVLEKISEVKKYLIVEKSKLELKTIDIEHFNKIAEQLKLPLKVDFKQHFNQLLLLKDKVESLQVGDSELQKSILDNMYTVLEALDENATKLVSRMKLKKNYELKNYWDDYNVSIINEKSIEKFNLLVKAVEEVEKYGHQFLETKNSIV